MKRYKAVKNGTAIFLSSEKQIKEKIKIGFSIYEVDERGIDRLVASPYLSPDESIKIGKVTRVGVLGGRE